MELLEAELEAEAGLPMTWYDVLLHLHERPGGRCRMGELAEAIVLSRSGLTTVVDRMEEAGLLQRRLVPGDRRAVDVALTAAGRRRFAAAAAVHRRGIDEHFVSHLSTAEGRALARALERVRDAARARRATP
jgi:DNA-binding MarR family transcriptional regulator